MLTLVCRYAFKDCEESRRDDDDDDDEQSICSAFAKLRRCDILPIVEKVLSLSCLTVPKCAGKWIARKGANATACPKPLVPTTSELMRASGLRCSPPCDENAWNATVGSRVFYTALYTSTTFGWICLIIILITWIKVKEL